MAKRIVIFAHYDKRGIIADYVVFYLKNLKLFCEKIIFVSTAKVNKKEIKKIEGICDKIIIRENSGYDFYSWKVGIKNTNNLSSYDEMIICNDSVYAPLFPLDNMFSLMEKKKCDFWGITDNGQFSYHLQSYFIVFRQNILRSNTFHKFWDRVSFEKTKMDIILKSEIGLTAYLIKHGFKCRTFFRENLKFKLKVFLRFFEGKFNYEIGYIGLLKYLLIYKRYHFSVGLNKLHHFWRELIFAKIPIIKIELLRDNPKQVNLENFRQIIKKKTNYQIELIDKNMSIESNVEKNIKIFPKNFNHLNDKKWLKILFKSIHSNKIENVEMPKFPDENTQKLFTSLSGEKAIKEAFDFFKIAKNQSKKLQIPFNKNSKFLDFGSGWGRISRCFLKDLNSENMFGIDVFAYIVECCKKVMPYGNFSVCDFSPPTDFNNDTFDIIVSYSVFSHLPEDLHLKWIQEFSRILKPNGILVVTTFAKDFVFFCKSALAKPSKSEWHKTMADAVKKEYSTYENALKEYKSGNFFHLPTGGGYFLPKENYGWTVISKNYIKKNWKENFSFKKYINNRKLPQAVIIMQKN